MEVLSESFTRKSFRSPDLDTSSLSMIAPALECITFGRAKASLRNLPIGYMGWFFTMLGLFEVLARVLALHQANYHPLSILSQLG